MKKILNFKSFGLVLSMCLIAFAQNDVFAMEGGDNTNSSGETHTFSFFDAPLPRYTSDMFARDPAEIGRNLARPYRPIYQISSNIRQVNESNNQCNSDQNDEVNANSNF